MTHRCTSALVDAFFETGLRGYLRFNQIDTLYVAGIETNICVLCTALTALTHGFATVILEDCVATSLADLHAPALRIIEVAKGRRMRIKSSWHRQPRTARPQGTAGSVFSSMSRSSYLEGI